MTHQPRIPRGFEECTVHPYHIPHVCKLSTIYEMDQSATVCLCAVCWCRPAGSAGLKRKVRFILLDDINRGERQATRWVVRICGLRGRQALGGVYI